MRIYFAVTFFSNSECNVFRLRPSSHLALASLGISSHTSLDQLSRKSKQESVSLNKQKLYKDLLQRFSLFMISSVPLFPITSVT